MGWITGSYGMTTNIGLLQAEIDETTLNLNSEDKVQINLANANTWTGAMAINSSVAGTGNQLTIQNGSGITVAQFQGGGNQIYSGLGNIPTISLQGSGTTTFWTIGSANGSGGSDDLTIWNQNTAYQFLVLNPSKQTIFGVNNSANSVSTLHNTLDDGSGNITITGSQTLPEDTSANGNTTGLFFEGGTGYTNALIANTNYGSGQPFLEIYASTQTAASTIPYEVDLYADNTENTGVSVVAPTTTAGGAVYIYYESVGTSFGQFKISNNTITGTGILITNDTSSSQVTYIGGSNAQGGLKISSQVGNVATTATLSAYTTSTVNPYPTAFQIIGTNAAPYFQVKTGNNTLDDGSGNATFTASGAGIVSANGIKTTAGAATTVSVGASPYTYTNSSASNQQIFIQGGTVSAISFNPNGGTGIALSGLTDNVLTMRPNDTLTITYTAVPTVNTIQL